MKRQNLGIGSASSPNHQLLIDPNFACYWGLCVGPQDTGRSDESPEHSSLKPWETIVQLQWKASLLAEAERAGLRGKSVLP